MDEAMSSSHAHVASAEPIRIMKVEGGGERTRFPCLATVRWTVATVLSVLAVAVVLMVIAAFFRPKNLELWVLHRQVDAVLLNGASTSNSCGSAGVYYCFGILLQPATNLSSGGGTTVAGHLDLRVSLSTNNPSGRADIYVRNITIRVLHKPFPSNFTGLVELLAFHLEVGGYRLKRDTAQPIRKWAEIRDEAALAYIAARHGNATSFGAMLQVNSTISPVALVNKTSPRLVVTHYCWPVTVSLVTPRADQEAVRCTPRADLYVPIDWSPPPPPTTTTGTAG
ncbi:hypothetical protein ACP4OV_017326 [Aristida adscensionis]